MNIKYCFSEEIFKKEEPILFENCESITFDDEKFFILIRLRFLRKRHGEYVNKLHEKIRREDKNAHDKKVIFEIVNILLLEITFKVFPILCEG